MPVTEREDSICRHLLQVPPHLHVPIYVVRVDNRHPGSCSTFLHFRVSVRVTTSTCVPTLVDPQGRDVRTPAWERGREYGYCWLLEEIVFVARNRFHTAKTAESGVKLRL